VRDRQTVLRGQLTELFMGEAHDYRMRMIIKRPRTVSTEIFPVTLKRARRCISHAVGTNSNLSRIHARAVSMRLS
jgi:hypothetical protein